jgi:hypothetical protein
MRILKSAAIKLANKVAKPATTDGIVATLQATVTKLRTHSDRQKAAADQHAKLAADHYVKSAEADVEAQRALRVAGKVAELLA